MCGRRISAGPELSTDQVHLQRVIANQLSHEEHTQQEFAEFISCWLLVSNCPWLSEVELVVGRRKPNIKNIELDIEKL